MVRADGHVSLTGRLKDVIVRKGENISAKEIEDLLVQPSPCDRGGGDRDPRRHTRGDGLCRGAVGRRGRAGLDLDEVVAFCRQAGSMTQKIPNGSRRARTGRGRAPARSSRRRCATSTPSDRGDRPVRRERPMTGRTLELRALPPRPGQPTTVVFVCTATLPLVHGGGGRPRHGRRRHARRRHGPERSPARDQCRHRTGGRGRAHDPRTGAAVRRAGFPDHPQIAHQISRGTGPDRPRGGPRPRHRRSCAGWG